MNNEKRDEIIIRLDERVKVIHDWIPQHEQKHTNEKAAKRKWTLAALTLIGGVLTRLFFWK